MSTDQFRVEVADVNYWRKQIKCQWGCPVNTDARGYVIAIAEGRYLEAYRHARGPNPFASICGRVCGAPCEVSCRRGDIDDALTIRALKRFVTEQHGAEAGDPAATIQFSTARRDAKNPKAGMKVAIIGAGFAGLTAAHDLALLGYKVTVFESESVAGGMLMVGVPTYRLPRELVHANHLVGKKNGVLNHTSINKNGFTPNVELSINRSLLGLLIFLGTEAMFFAGLISAFLILKAGSTVWPPVNQPRLPVAITAINTLVLLVSAYTMHRAVKAVRAGQNKSLTRWLAMTGALATVFLGVQGAEWIRLVKYGLTFSSSNYGATFYTLIGAHGLHMLAAVLEF